MPRNDKSNYINGQINNEQQMYPGMILSEAMYVSEIEEPPTSERDPI